MLLMCAWATVAVLRWTAHLASRSVTRLATTAVDKTPTSDNDSGPAWRNPLVSRSNQVTGISALVGVIQSLLLGAMDTSARQRQRLSFGQAADLYDRVRPTYPADAVEWILGSEPRRVIDLGAGTGIFSRRLAELGHEVIAVEPDAGMRETLLATSPGVTAVEGSAEAIPLPDESVDAVVAAQAYHWFDREVAHPEIARVIRPGGVFAPIWNIRDETIPWVAELSRIVGSVSAGPSSIGDGFGSLFGPVERFETRHSTVHTADTLVALIASRSYFLTASPEERQRIESELRQLVADLGEEFELPYLTIAYRAASR